MDLLEHAAGVWARKYAVLAVAVLVALGVYGWQATMPERYDATTTVQVRLPDTQTGDPSGQVAFYAETVAGLTTSRAVVADALEAAGLEADDEAVDDAVDDVTVTLGSDPGFVALTASGSTPEEAVALSDALAAELVDRIAADQAADLDGQRAAVTLAIAELGRDRAEALDAGADPFERAALEREREALLGSLRTLAEVAPWRLAVVEPAEAPTSPSAPTPLRDALLALILALIIAAEVVVIRRAIRGSLSARDPAKEAGEIAGVPAVVVRPGGSATALTPLLPAVGSARAVTVVQTGGDAQARTAALLSELLEARGSSVLLLDAGAERADDDRPLSEVVDGASEERVTLSVSVASVDDLLPLVADLEGPTVLDVGADVTKRELRSTADTLRGLGLDLVAVTVSTRS